MWGPDFPFLIRSSVDLRPVLRNLNLENVSFPAIWKLLLTTSQPACRPNAFGSPSLVLHFTRGDGYLPLH